MQIQNYSGLSLIAWARRPAPWPGVVAPSPQARSSRSSRPARTAPALSLAIRRALDSVPTVTAQCSVGPPCSGPKLPLQPGPACRPRRPGRSADHTRIQPTPTQAVHRNSHEMEKGVWSRGAGGDAATRPNCRVWRRRRNELGSPLAPIWRRPATRRRADPVGVAIVAVDEARSSWQ